MKCVYRSDGVVIRLLEWLKPTTASIPLLRTQLYYMVCIVFRLALYNLVFVLRNEWYVPWMVGMGALLSIAHLSSSAFLPDQPQWWSKKFQWTMSVLVMVACMFTIQKKIPTWVVPFLLYMSVVGGLIQRWTCCCH